jgi:CheY-like chemotaxis protein
MSSLLGTKKMLTFFPACMNSRSARQNHGTFCIQVSEVKIRFQDIREEDDVIDFMDEELESVTHLKAREPWKILIADDDVSVHDTTLLALAGVQIHDRPLEFSHAYSAREARQVIQQNPDMSLVLLDVVMETVDAGLKLVGIIRNELERNDLRIILRTGQPGYAPEQLVSREFAIDGYTTKSKLTRSLLISVLSDSLAAPRSTQGLCN